MEPTPHKPGHCHKANEVIALIGDKWTVHIVMLLATGKQRFSEIQRAVDGISRKMLTTTLRGLERDGYVTRSVYATIPPRVDYELTPFGHQLSLPLRALGDWAATNHQRVLDARLAYDNRTEP